LCRRKATTGFSYCGYHLPLDQNSGYMYCVHTRTGGRPCGNPVLKEGDRLCKYHKPDGSGPRPSDPLFDDDDYAEGREEEDHKEEVENW
jgi:hypothetical protein